MVPSRNKLDESLNVLIDDDYEAQILYSIRQIEQQKSRLPDASVDQLTTEAIDRWQKVMHGLSNARLDLLFHYRQEIEQIAMKAAGPTFNVVVEQSAILYKDKLLHDQDLNYDLTIEMQRILSPSKSRETGSTRVEPPKISGRVGYLNLPLARNSVYGPSFESISKETGIPMSKRYEPLLQYVKDLRQDPSWLRVQAHAVSHKIPELGKTNLCQIDRQRAQLQVTIEGIAKQKQLSLVLDSSEIWLGSGIVGSYGYDITSEVVAKLRSELNE
jgi:hypothetical protein